MSGEISGLSSLKDVVIAIAALTGMGLGLYNLWSEKQKDKIKLEIIPKSVKQKGVNTLGKGFVLTTANEFQFDQGTDLYAFEVINHSKFSITVDEVGFLNSKTNGRNTISNPILMDDGKWPRKLEPRESATFYADLPSILNIKHLSSVTSAFAKTSCNHTEIGTSNSLKQLIEHSREKP
jgi:hypothetical protein